MRCPPKCRRVYVCMYPVKIKYSDPKSSTCNLVGQHTADVAFTDIRPCPRGLKLANCQPTMIRGRVNDRFLEKEGMNGDVG